MAFFIKNTGGPGVPAGFFPDSDNDVPCVNRSGATLSKGEVAMLDMAAASTEITTNDSNSYRPGAGDASDDSVWNTVINPTAAAIQNGGTFFGIAQEDVADNATGKFRFFGISEQAFVFRVGGTTTTVSGAPLTVTTTNTLDAERGTNERIIAMYLDASDATLTNRELKRVFLHNGILGASAGTAVSA